MTYNTSEQTKINKVLIEKMSVVVSADLQLVADVATACAQQ